jgi:hypothetical protein
MIELETTREKDRDVQQCNLNAGTRFATIKTTNTNVVSSKGKAGVFLDDKLKSQEPRRLQGL